MDCRQKDKEQAFLKELALLERLPRQVLGAIDSWPNLAIGEPHAHPWVQLSYAVEGVLTVFTDTARFIAPSNRAIWIPPGLRHRVTCTSNTSIRSIYITPEAIEPRQCGAVEIDPLIREMIVAFSKLPIEYDETNSEGRLVQVLIDRVNAAKPCDLKLPWPSDPDLSTICHFLAKNPDCRFPMEKFSSSLGISEKTLSRRFSKQAGMSFRQWRQRCRIFAALPLLENGDRITDIAIACGYDTLSAFSAAFGEIVGCTPREYTNESKAE